MKVKSLSPVRLFPTPWTVAYQAPRPLGFSRQEYWSGVPFPSPFKIARENKSSLNPQGKCKSRHSGYVDEEAEAAAITVTWKN